MFVKLIKNLLKNTFLYDFARQVYRVTGVAGESCPLVYHCRDYTSNIHVRKFLKAFVTPFYIFKYFHIQEVKGRKGLAFVLIAKNEAPYIEEWINFHHKQGVSHFIIYDNESEDNLYEVLKPYILAGLVTYRTIRGKIRQLDAYNMAIAGYSKKFKYMGFIDADEFVFVRKNALLGGGHDIYKFVDGFMNEHKNAGGLAVHWCLFGSSGHETRPEGGVLENYTMRAEDNDIINNHIKTICDPVKIFSYSGVHCPSYRRGFYNLHEDGTIAESARTKKILFSKIRINHYFTKSKQEYIEKKNRGRADYIIPRTMRDFEEYDKNNIHDIEILSYV